MAKEKQNDWLNEFIQNNAFPIILAIIGVAALWGRFKIRVQALENRVDRLSGLVERVIVLEERERTLESDVKEIKQDVKEIKRRLR